jgi:hypothetical protein
MLTLLDLLAFCKANARISASDYFDSRYARPDEVAAWKSDCARRQRQRKACFRAFPGRLSKASEALIPGNYGRLSIGKDGQPSYTVGQYAPLEIWHALSFYLEATNEIETSRWTARGPGAAIDQPWQALRPLC